MLAGIVAVVSITILNDILYLDSQIDNLHLFFFFGSRLHFNFLLSFLRNRETYFCFLARVNFPPGLRLVNFQKEPRFIITMYFIVIMIVYHSI